MLRPLGLAVFLAVPLRAQPREVVSPAPTPQTPVSGVNLRTTELSGLALPGSLALPTALPSATALPNASAPTPTRLPSAAAPQPAQAPRTAMPKAALPGAAPAALSGSLQGSQSLPGKESPRALAEGNSSRERDAEALSQEGRLRFDQARAVSAQAPEAVEAPAASPSLWNRAVSWLKKADEAPSFPGASGGKVRIAGKSYTLGAKLSESPDSAVYRVLEQRDYTLTLHAPSAAGLFAQRVRDLEALAKTDIPHALLRAASPSTRVLLQETPEEIPSFRLGAGPLAPQQKNGLADFAAKLILAGRSADLSPRSMLWDHWRTTWRLREGTGFAPAGPAAVLGQLLEPGFAENAGLDPAAFLAALRGRLGPDSAAWKAAAASASALPHLQAAFAALEKADAALPTPPLLRFGPGRADPKLDDSWVDRGELAKRLGFDPFAKHDRFDLHADDPGKLNTRILQVNPKGGGTPRVMKSSSLEIIRNELFIRKVIRRWFGAYLDTPPSLAVRDADGATMLMERSEGSRSYTGKELKLEERIAFAILAHTFGLSDVNPGNVLFSAGKRPVLIDFEQALGRRRPTQRIPDAGILQELPWVNGDLIPTVEQHQPSLRAWRELLAEPGTRAELEKMMRETGWDKAETAARLDTVYDNAARLEWNIQSDVEFARGFIRQR